MFSFVCPSNQQEQVDRFVRASLEKQSNKSYELIVVDTAEQRYASAAEALNAGADRARGQYLVFLHHDVAFDDPNFLDELAGYLTNRSFRIAGVAGCVRKKNVFRKWMLTNIVHGERRKAPTHSSTFAKPMACETLDECFFVIPHEIWECRHFEVFYPSWHLYAVEYSLWANSEEVGSCLVLPLGLWHRSNAASFDESYYRALWVLRKKYSRKFRFLYTPMGAWPTNRALLQLRIAFDRVKRLAQEMGVRRDDCHGRN